MPLREYRVHWEVDVDARSPIHAARRALEMHRDVTSLATVFTVRRAGSPLPGTQIDLGAQANVGCLVHLVWYHDKSGDVGDHGHPVVMGVFVASASALECAETLALEHYDDYVTTTPEPISLAKYWPTRNLAEGRWERPTEKLWVTHEPLHL